MEFNGKRRQTGAWRRRMMSGEVLASLHAAFTLISTMGHPAGMGLHTRDAAWGHRCRAPVDALDRCMGKKAPAEA